MGALAAVGALVALTACQHVVFTRVTEARSAAGVPALAVSKELQGVARNRVAAMCAAGAAVATTDATVLDPGGLARAVREVVGSAAIDPDESDAKARTAAAVDEIWAEIGTDPTFVDAPWDHLGVAHLECGDGKVYLSAVLRDAPPGLHPDSRVWLFMGQELGAVGGFPGDHDQGYVDYVGMPAGVTTYADLRFIEFAYQRYNVGTGDLCSQCYVDAPQFDDAMIALGLYIVGDLENIVSGARDGKIQILGEWIAQIDRPVFLRIGYEFDGSWNGYDPTFYKQAFQRIVDRLRAQGVHNLVTVWQSSGTTRNVSTLMRWYPGDEYVDWVGYSYFNQSFNPGDGVLTIARERRKPAMIAEATPKRNLSLGSEDTHWDAWFQTFFDRVEADSDVVKAVAYINTRWFAQPAWDKSWGDSRVQIRPTIKSRWIERISHPLWAEGDTDNAANTYVLTPEDLTPP